MTATFVANSMMTAIGQAVEQSRNGQWRGVYRRGRGLFEVHDAPPADSHYRLIMTARGGTMKAAPGPADDDVPGPADENVP